MSKDNFELDEVVGDVVKMVMLVDVFSPLIDEMEKIYISCLPWYEKPFAWLKYYLRKFRLKVVLFFVKLIFKFKAKRGARK